MKKYVDPVIGTNNAIDLIPYNFDLGPSLIYNERNIVCISQGRQLQLDIRLSVMNVHRCLFHTYVFNFMIHNADGIAID